MEFVLVPLNIKQTRSLLGSFGFLKGQGEIG
jgi:hypothetical protein